MIALAAFASWSFEAGKNKTNNEIDNVIKIDDGRIAGGYVAGQVSIGPFCPVEQEGVPCEVPAEAYTSREVVIYKSDGDIDYIETERVPLDKKGNYRIALGPGNYLAQIQPAGIGAGEKKPFTIVSFETTTVDFDIDTGIR